MLIASHRNCVLARKSGLVSLLRRAWNLSRKHAVMKIENRGKRYFPWEKNRQAYFFL